MLPFVLPNMKSISQKIIIISCSRSRSKFKKFEEMEKLPLSFPSTTHSKLKKNENGEGPRRKDLKGGVEITWSFQSGEEETEGEPHYDLQHLERERRGRH